MTSHGGVGVVVGPAGSGKTTLLSQWSQNLDRPLVWLRAEPTDIRPHRLARRLMSRVARVAGTQPGNTTELVDVAKAIASTQGPFAVVLDDLHVIAGSASENGLERFLVQLPSSTSVLVSSRRTPRVNLTCAELDNSVVINRDDLRFRSWEVERLFRDVYGTPLRPDAAAKLAHHTDGWAAALQLFHSATGKCARAERNRAVMSLARRSRFAQAYLSGQVLAELPDELTDFLLRTSVFDNVTAERCDELLDRHDSQVLLTELEQRQMLITTDDDGETFRYHDVLRRHLDGTLRHVLGTAGTRALYLRTAQILETGGTEVEAIRARCRAEDWDGVRRLLRGSGEWLTDPSAPDWLERLPAWVTDGDPWVALAEARHLLYDGRLAAAQRAARAVERDAPDPLVVDVARRIDRLATAWLPEPDRLVHGWPAALSAATRARPAAAAEQRADDPAASDESRLALVVANLLTGAQRTACAALGELSEDVPPGSVVGLVCRALAAALEAMCDVRTTDELDAVQVTAARSGFDWLARVVHGVVLAVGSDIADSQACAEVVADCDRLGDPWGAALITMVRAIRSAGTAQPDLALIDSCARRFDRLGAGTLATWARCGQALIAVRLGVRGAAELARSAETQARRLEVPGALAIAHAAVDLASGVPHASDRADRLASAIGLSWRPWAVPTSTGSAVPDRPDATAAPVAVTAGAPGATAPTAGGSAASTLVTVVAAVGPHVELRLFGGFSVSVDGELVDLSGVRPLACTVLRMLALHAGRGVHRDKLTDLFWPDLPTTRAAHNLQVAVASLRAALQPSVPGRDSKILVRSGDAYMIALHGSSSSDVRDFERLLDEARKARAEDRLDDLAAILGRALAICRGELLPEDGADEWVTDARDRFTMQAANAAGLLAELELTRGNHADAIAAAMASTVIDPWRDASWRVLITAHEQVGDKAAVLRAQRRYAEVLRSLDVTPEWTDDPALSS